jgi:hypothetical protein
MSAILSLWPRRFLVFPIRSSWGDRELCPLSAHHYDNRTLGMLHISGQAAEVGGPARDWSCVVKVLDLGQPPRAINFVDPAHEVLVYRNQVFATDDLSFRPARSYRVGGGSDGTTLRWLEDLTGLRTPPFTIDELGTIATHLGS